jgi:phage FluMu gp28-like protein
VLTAAAQISAGGQNVWYMGYDKDMALEFIDVCAMWARAFGIVADDVGEELLDVDGVNEGVQSFRIRFASGFKITALPSVPRALRGKQGIVIIDEAAFHKNVDEVIKSAMALLIWGGKVIIVSTHDGVGNRFNQLLDEIRSGRRRGEVMTITFADAMADGLYERVQLVAKTKGIDLPPKDQWEAGIRASYGEDAGEELDCIPKTGAGSLIKPEDIAAAEHDDAGKPSSTARAWSMSAGTSPAGATARSSIRSSSSATCFGSATITKATTPRLRSRTPISTTASSTTGWPMPASTRPAWASRSSRRCSSSTARAGSTACCSPDLTGSTWRSRCSSGSSAA